MRESKKKEEKQQHQKHHFWAIHTKVPCIYNNKKVCLGGVKSDVFDVVDFFKFNFNIYI